MSARDAAEGQTVLIVSTDPLLGALLGLLVELEGHRPVYEDRGESPRSALSRHRPRIVLVDADHGDGLSDAFLERAVRGGAAVVIYGAGHPDDEVRELARERGLAALPLPTDGATFGRTLALALRPRS